MMNRLLMILLFTCAFSVSKAQVNYVKNSDFEKYDTCPYSSDQLVFVNFWRGAIDSAFKGNGEYFNSCGNSSIYLNLHVPNNNRFYQFPHSGNGFVGGHLFFDKAPPAPPGGILPPDYRDYFQGHLSKNLVAGKTYCISFWINTPDATAYFHNKIGAYLDNGDINKLPLPSGSEITSVTPQVYTDSVIKDTLNWVKIEGSFIAIGNETYITIGNFFKNSDVTTITSPYYSGQYSYYLIDDVSVIPIDLSADAGKDSWVEMGKQIKIGRVGDTTAIGLDCKWYKKGVLIDSGAIITVNANAVENAVDTYVVVQTICGLVKTDTVKVKTAGVGIAEYGFDNSCNVYPNPSKGAISISYSITPQGIINIKVYDLLGRVVHQEQLAFSIKKASINLNIPNGSYILELKDEAGNAQRERIVIQ